MKWKLGLCCGFFLLAFGAGLTGCHGVGDGEKYPVKVVCTTGMVADLVRNVGGERLAVTQLMGADVDPHTFRPAAGDVAKLNNATLIFYSGLHLEGKMTDIFERVGRK